MRGLIAEGPSQGRALEWYYAFWTVFFGAFLMAPFEALYGAPFQWVTSRVPEIAWGQFFLFVGGLHVFALTINGRRWWTPWARIGVLAPTLAVTGAFVAGFIVDAPRAPGLYLFAAQVCAAIYCIGRAYRDALHEKVKARGRS